MLHLNPIKSVADLQFKPFLVFMRPNKVQISFKIS